MKTFILSLSLFLSAYFSLSAQKIEYKISFPAPHTHYCSVVMNVSETTDNEAVIVMPVWSPGSYLVREYSKNMEKTLFRDTKGNILKHERISKNEWRVKVPADKTFTFEYDYYAFEMSVRTSFIDETHAYLNPVSVFPFLKGAENKSGTLLIQPHPSWKKVSAALPAVQGNEHLRSFADFDEFADSPIEIGNHEVFEFTAAGIPHKVAVYGEADYKPEIFTKDFKKIAEATTEIFGKNPCKEYLFIVHNLENGSGGLEHKNSTTLQVRRSAYATEGGRLGLLSLAAHEYFHLWNVKRLRPAGLGPFDYSKENYTTLLWFSEGITSYFDELILYRAGYTDLDALLRTYFEKINSSEKRYGNNVQSLADSSFDAWVKFYRPNENSANSTVSYYEKGSIMGFVLDIEIAARTKGEKNLSDFMRHMYEEFAVKKNVGFSEADLLATLNAFSKSDFTEFFNQHIFGTVQIDYASVFEKAGISTKKFKSLRKNWGISLKEENGKIFITNLARESFGYNSGLSVNDELIAVNHIRLKSTNDLSAWERNVKEGEKVVFHYVRDGKIAALEKEMKLVSEVNFYFENSEAKTTEQKKIFNKAF